MHQPQSESRFRTTQWSLLLAAARSDPSALESILTQYWGPIYAYIRRCGRSRDDAADLTQEFIAQVVLDRDLLAHADPARGRFRTLLKAGVRNFLVDQHRRSTARARGPGAPILGSPALDDIEPPADTDPSDAFDRQWAATLLSITLDRVHDDCESCGQSLHWEAFLQAVINPALGHTHPTSLDALAQELHAGDATHLSSMIQTVRRKFRRALRAAIEETLADPAEADAELSALRTFLHA